jgi:hypothetical protein
MRKQTLLFCSFLTIFASAASAEPNPLYEEFSRAKEVKVFVRLPMDSGASKLDAEGFKTAIETVLKERKSIHFAKAASEAEAKLIVESDIKGFVFSLTDPVDMLVGVGMAAMDAAKVDHFASVDVHYTVRDASGKTRYDDVVHASITDEKFTEEEARQQILARVSEVFVRTAFGKKK